MQSFCYIIFFLSFSLVTFAQDSSKKPFLLQRTEIDSIVTCISNNPSLSSKVVVGNAIFGTFRGAAYYNSNHDLLKIVYNFEPDSSGEKVFYYNDAVLIKIVDRGTALYNTRRGLVYANEFPCDSLRSAILLTFSRQYRNLVSKILK